MRDAREAGFTLVELILAIVLMSIVVGALGQALFVGFRTTTATATTLEDASQAQTLASRLQTDVKAADALGTTGGPTCEPTFSPPAAPLATRVLWTQREVAPGARVVAAYVVKHVPADAAAGTEGHAELRRVECTVDAAGVSAPPAMPDGILLARWADPAVVPQVSCDDRPRSGGQTTLDAVLLPGVTDVKLAATATESFPASGPYELVVGGVGGEAMTVTGGAGTTDLTVAPRAGVEHPGGALVTWGPGVLAAPLTDSDSDTMLKLTDETGLPATGPAYPLAVGGETMTVTGGFGTDELTVARHAAAEHPAGSAATFASCGAGGTFRGAPVETTLAAPLADDAEQLTLAAGSGGTLPSAPPAYPIIVGGETMTVTARTDDTLAVTRAPTAIEHLANARVTWGETILQQELGPADATVVLNDAGGFPATGPAYPLVVVGETMTVTGGFGTASLTVSRPSPADAAHPARTPVTWAQALLGKRMIASDRTLELTDASGFPASGPNYRIVVGDELMTVTGGFGTTELAVSRASGVAHEITRGEDDGAVVGSPVAVGWTPALVTMRLPAGGSPGATPITVSVMRRVT